MNYKLPDECFIGFEALQLAKRSLLWGRSADLAEEYLAAYGWCLPLPGESQCIYGSNTVTMRAERYGGRGIGYNGGGVRCGVHQGKLIKGIGKTLLAGEGAPYEHSYGGATANAAVRELVWGEIFNLALPHGAITVDAIIQVGGGLKISGRSRTLTIRPTFTRLGHFMSSPTFRPTKEFTERYVSDSLRTAAAIQVLRENLHEALGYIDGSSVSESVSRLFERFAVQIAAAKVKRLVHSSLSPSNISLDGRFVDFGGASSISGHSPIIVAPGGNNAQNEHGMLAEAIDELCFYIWKYSGLQTDLQTMLVETRSRFFAKLRERAAIETLKLTGVPEVYLSSLPHSTIHRWVAPIMEVAANYAGEPFRMQPTCDGYAPSYGTNHLGACLLQIMLADSQEKANLAMQNHSLSSGLRTRFSAALFEIRTEFVRWGEGLGFSAAEEFIGFNCSRLNGNLDFLHFYNLRNDIDNILASPDGLPGFVEDIVARANFLLSDSSLDGASNWKVSGCNFGSDARMGTFLNGHKVNLQQVLSISIQP